MEMIKLDYEFMETFTLHKLKEIGVQNNRALRILVSEIENE